MQRQAGEGVVGIEDYAVAADFADEEGARAALGWAGSERISSISKI